MNKWEGLQPDDRVVIPAHNEEASIGLVVNYLMEHGLRGEQLLVVDSGCTDGTVERARLAAKAHEHALRIIQPEVVLAPFLDRLAKYGLQLTRFGGKGLAMYAAVLALRREGHLPDSRIFFIDGDITNPDAVDPIGCLLRAWNHKPGAKIAKLASAGRENEGMLAFVNTLPNPYRQISNLAWPLCGQQSLRLADLQEIPFPTDYSVEMALLAALVESYGGGCFAQEPVPVHLAEEKHPDDLQRYTRMFTRIMLFMQSVVAKGGLVAVDVHSWNQEAWRAMGDIGVPHVSSENGSRETITVDQLLPPINSLVYSVRQ